MTATWPSTLPTPRWSGSQKQAGKRVKRFEVDDGGPAEQGVFTTATPKTFTFILRCTFDQADTLFDFYDGHPAEYFTFPDPVTGDDVTARFHGDHPPQDAGSARNKRDIQITLEYQAS